MAYEDVYGGQPVATTDDFMQNPLINNFATRGLLSGIQWLGETLGKPQAALFGAATGDFKQLANLIPFSDTLGITNTGDPEKGLTTQRVGGRDLLRHYGLADHEDNYGNFAGGLALDIIADPLAFIKGPAGALTKAGEAAQKAGTLERTVAGRMASGTGGLFSITNKPWYAEMLPGAAKAENAFVAGVSPALQQSFQKIAQGMDSGWNAATRATVPGTEFSPLAWLRSAFEPGAGNISGNPVVTDVFGQVNRPKYQELVKNGTDVVSGTNILGKQADYLNAASQLGMDNTKASVLAHDIGSYMRETGESTLPAWLTAGEDPAHVALATKYGKDWGNVIDSVVTNPRQEAIKVGIDVGDTSKQGWKFDYAPRAQADSGNKLAMHAAARNEEFAKVPGGAAMVNKIMSDPLYAGSKKITGMDFDAAINAGTAKWAPIIQDEATKRLAKVYPATAQDVPEALVKLTTPEGAADLARTMVGHAADDGLDAATRGFFYRPDLANNLLDYPKNFAKKTATAHSAIETLSREAENFGKLVGNKPTTEGFMRLDEALSEIKLPGAADELAARIGIPKAQLEDHGVPESLVKALNKEVNPTPRGEKSAWSKMVDSFRYGVTVPWPGNFVRNWSSQVLDEGLSGTGAFKNLGRSVDILRGAMTDPAEFARMQPKLQKAIEYGVVGTDQVHALLGTGFDKAGNAAINVKPAQSATSMIQSLKDFAEPMWSAAKGRDVGVTPLSELAAQTSMNPTAKAAAGYIGSVVDPVRRYMGTMETAHRFQNDATRLQQFSNLLESGWSPAAAAEKVKTIQRDFLEGSTPFVSQTLRNVVPFGNFAVQNLRTQADLLSSQTGRYSALMQLLNSGRSSGGFVPEYASSGTAIPLPGAEPGQQRFLGSLGLTQEDEMTSALTSLMAGRPTEAVRKFLSGSNPLIKVPYELATGTQLFSGRRLDDLQPGAVASFLTGGNNPGAARTLAAVASGTPAARLFSTVYRLADIERRGPINLLANLATGIRTVDVDQQAASQIAARDTITKLLNASDQYKLRENLVVDPAWKGREQEMPDQIKQLFQQYELLQKQGKLAAQQKAAASR
jgi:hypothetical protein